MSLLMDKTREQSKMTSTIVDVGLDLLEILQFGQIAVAVGAMMILLREFLL